jgi:hypothetical protein
VGKEVMTVVEELVLSSSLTQKEVNTDLDLQSVASVETFNYSGFFSGSLVVQALIVAAKSNSFKCSPPIKIFYREAMGEISREKFIHNFKRLMRSFV